MEGGRFEGGCRECWRALAQKRDRLFSILESSTPHSSIARTRSMDADTGIAIIGMGCRLPGDAASLESFWELLSQGRSCWSEIPPERWNAAAYYHPSAERKGTVSLHH